MRSGGGSGNGRGDYGNDKEETAAAHESLFHASFPSFTETEELSIEIGGYTTSDPYDPTNNNRRFILNFI